MTKKFINYYKENWESLFLILILALAFFLRFYKLSFIPPGLYPDIAVNGTDAISSIKNHIWPVFYVTNNGREALFINLIAVSFRIFGVSVLSIRIISALFGGFTVLGLYLLVKELFNKKIALFSSFFLAVSFWHINFSRMGFRAIVLPFVLVFAFYFLFRGFRTKKFLNFIIGGLFFGLGLHTYISFRLAPLILIIWVLLRIFLDKNFWHKYWSKLLIFVIASIVSAFPLLYYFFLNPADFMGRASDVSVFGQPHAIQLLIINTLKSLGMFNIYGDSNWRHNLSGTPMFTIILGLLFLGGLIFIIQRLFRDFKNRSQNKFFEYLFLILWFIIMLLPTILSSEGIPHALRALGVIPVTIIFAGLFTARLFNLKFWNRYKRYIKIIVMIILLVIVGGLEINRYFCVWARDSNTYSAFNQNLVNIGDYLNNLPQGTVKYIVVNENGVLVDGLPIQSQTIKFVTYGKSYPSYILPSDLKRINSYPRNSVIVFIKDDQKLFDYMQKHFNGKIEKIDLIPNTGSEFYIFRIN
jgi:4-amino-4-deoxy-L-arabinose transferase-like glycosyltransferase